jgi:hypothetical protein
MKQCGEHDPERLMSQARVDGASTGISPGRNAGHAISSLIHPSGPAGQRLQGIHRMIGK